MTVRVTASASLALTKYWGKLSCGVNLPATPSLAVTLEALSTTTYVERSREPVDEVTIDGHLRTDPKVSAFFDFLRRELSCDHRFRVVTSNAFPTGAGLASSSSGFAALAAGCSTVAGRPDLVDNLALLSRLARHGSGSASRAVYGGFTEWSAGAESAHPVHPGDHWPELRVIAFVTSGVTKTVASREAMVRAASTSPVYPVWVREAPVIHAAARDALARCDLDSLGEAMRRSYLLMFATMYTSSPSTEYWNERTVAVRRVIDEVRRSGVGAWETMDAGPQVKVLCRSSDVPTIVDAVADEAPDVGHLVSGVGGGLLCSVVPAIPEDWGANA